MRVTRSFAGFLFLSKIIRRILVKVHKLEDRLPLQIPVEIASTRARRTHSTSRIKSHDPLTIISPHPQVTCTLPTHKYTTRQAPFPLEYFEAEHLPLDKIGPLIPARVGPFQHRPPSIILSSGLRHCFSGKYCQQRYQNQRRGQITLNRPGGLRVWGTGGVPGPGNARLLSTSALRGLLVRPAPVPVAAVSVSRAQRREMRIATLQIASKLGDVEGNVKRADELLRDAGVRVPGDEAGVPVGVEQAKLDILVLPELALTG